MSPFILAALGLLFTPVFAPPPPVPQVPTSPTCVGKASDGTTFASANHLWHIECDVDYWGNDLAASQQPTFELCITACDANSACVDVSYVGESCYMKKALSAASIPQGNCWTARKDIPTQEVPEVSPLPFSCVDKKDDGALYRTSSSVFKVVCGIDYAGNDLPATNAASFEACIDACAQIEACVDVSYVWGACYMKNKVETPIERAHVWSAVRQVETEIPEEPETPTTPTTPTEPIGPLSCEDKKSDKQRFVSPSGGLYLIECGIDYEGGDLAASVVATFEDCIKACDKNIACVDVSYVYGSCYLKGSLNPRVEAGHVWTARVLKSAKDTFTFPTATPQDIGTGTETFLNLPIVLPPAPTATLAPVSPPGINLGGLGVLTPATTAKLWYNGNEEEVEGGGATTVRLSIEYKHPSIILDYSIYIKDVVCDAAGLSGRFDTSETIKPYLYAISTWPQSTTVILITSAASCSPGQGQNVFFVAETVHFNDATKVFHATGSVAELADLYTSMDIDFGTIIADAPEEPEFSDTACGTPGQTVLNGLPALACGTDFDARLDEHLTFYSDAITGEEAIVRAAVPGTGLAIRKRIVRRGILSDAWNVVCDVVDAIVDVIVDTVKGTFVAMFDAFMKAVDVVVAVVQKVVSISIAIAVNHVKLLVFMVTGSYSNKLNIPINVFMPENMMTESPWGPAVNFYTFKRGEEDDKWSSETVAISKLNDLVGIEEDPEPGVELWCVNCGVIGKIVAEGSITATPLSGLTRGTIGITGNMYAGVYLGVNAFAKWEYEFHRDLLKVGLPGWSIPGIVTLGPQVILSVKATIGIEAEGQLITGASFTWPNFAATLDFVDRKKSSKSGWSPTVDSKFQAHGSLEASAALGLPVTVEFGIDILNGKYKSAIGLVDTPSIVASAEFSVDYGTETNEWGTDECYGVGWDIKLTNEVKVEVTDLAEWPLDEWVSPALAEGCIGWPKPGEEPEEPEEPDIPDIPTLPTADPITQGVQCPSAAGATYTDMTNNNWEIRCGSSYKDYVISANNSPNFESCIASCAQVPECIGVSFNRVGPTPDMIARGYKSCSLKSRWGGSNPVFYQLMLKSPVDTALLMSPFRIHSVVYADKDVTAMAMMKWVQGNRLIIDTNNLNNLILGPSAEAVDPWFGQPKTLAMLYSYGAEDRIFSVRAGVGIVTITRGRWDEAPYSDLCMNYSQDLIKWMKVIGIVWGPKIVKSGAVAQSVSQFAGLKKPWQFTNAMMGGDTWAGQGKTGVIWYRDTTKPAGSPPGDLYVLTGKENTYAAIWNPFRRRSMVWSEPKLVARQEANYNATRELLLGSGNSTWTNTTAPIAEPPAPVPLYSNVTAPINATHASALFTNATIPSNSTGPSASNWTVPATNTTFRVADDVKRVPDFAAVTILDTTSTFKLNSGKNGNLFLSNPSENVDISSLTSAELYAAFSGSVIAIVGDTSDRLLHYYPESMASLGVSRLRLATLSELPKGAKLVSLVEVEVKDNAGKMLVAITANSELFFPMLCSIQGQLNKIFLAKDVNTSPAVLETEDAKFTLTGGLASDCVPLALTVQGQTSSPLTADPSKV